jgi:hypothetical protein
MVKNCFDRILRVYILGKCNWHARLEKLARDKYSNKLRSKKFKDIGPWLILSVIYF